MKKGTIAAAIIICGILIAGAFMLKSPSSSGTSAPIESAKIENGTQIVEINARGGYSPRVSAAKAGVPTVIRFVTKGTFDCSLAVNIPSLGIQKILPQTGATDISIGTPNAGTLNGTCAMGMYRFEVRFE